MRSFKNVEIMEPAIADLHLKGIPNRSGILLLNASQTHHQVFRQFMVYTRPTQPGFLPVVARGSLSSEQ